MGRGTRDKKIDEVYRIVRTPKNYKSSKLIMGTYRKMDLIYLVGCLVTALIWLLLNLTFFVPTILSWVAIVIIPLQAIWLTSRHTRYHNNYEALKINSKYKKRNKVFYGYISKENKEIKKSEV